jgi:hypothetical protein
VTNLKKTSIIISLSLILLLSGLGIVQAQNGQQNRAQDPSSHDSETYVQGESGDQLQINAQDGSGSGSGQMFGQGLEDSTQNLNRVVTRKNNPETGEQVRVMAERHSEIKTQTQTALKKMSKRSGLAKFVLGPDYKNAGEVKGAVNQLNEDIDALMTLKESMWGLDSTDVDTAIENIQTEVEILEGELETGTSGFSLFGWLGKLISGF